MLTPELRLTKEDIRRIRKYEVAWSGVNGEAELQALCDMALAHLAAAQQRGAWQPIESAPRDGTQILGRVDYTDQMWTVVYLGGFHPNSPGKHVWRDAFSKLPVQSFESWMPLPAAPVNKESNRG